MAVYGNLTGGYSAFAHESVTVDNTVGGVALTTATFLPTDSAPACRAIITVETNPARFTINGTAPTTTVGHLVTDTDQFIIDGADNIGAFRAIRTTGSSATIHVTYLRK